MSIRTIYKCDFCGKEGDLQTESWMYHSKDHWLPDMNWFVSFKSFQRIDITDERNQTKEKHICHNCVAVHYKNWLEKTNQD